MAITSQWPLNVLGWPQRAVQGIGWRPAVVMAGGSIVLNRQPPSWPT
jgi:hypothetical protein